MFTGWVPSSSQALRSIERAAGGQGMAESELSRASGKVSGHWHLTTKCFPAGLTGAEV